MAVEILTVSLSSESIDAIAHQVARLMGGAPATQGNPPSSQNPQPAERSGFRQEGRAPQQDDGWSSEPVTRVHNATGGNQGAPSTAPQNGQDGPPMCNCGDPKRWVPPGYSERSGKSYPGFWACPRPRGQQCGR